MNSEYISISWFGTIMAGKEPVVESTLCRNILLDHYDLVAAAVIGLTTSGSVKHYPVRNALLILLPRLAAFKRKRFVEKYLTPAMQYLDKELQDKNKQEKYNVFLAIGILAVAVGEDIESHLRNVLAHIKLSLPPRLQYLVSSLILKVPINVVLLQICAQRRGLQKLPGQLQPDYQAG